MPLGKSSCESNVFFLMKNYFGYMVSLQTNVDGEDVAVRGQ